MYGIKLSVVIMSFVSLACSSNHERKVHDYPVDSPITFEDLPNTISLNEVKIWGKAKAASSSTPASSKQMKCGAWRNSLIGNRVKECEWE